MPTTHLGSWFLVVALAAGSSLAGCKASDPGNDAGSNDLGAITNCPMGTDDLISNFDRSNGIEATDGRQGGWYVYGDNNGTFDPPKIANAPYPIDMNMGNPNCSGAGSLRLKATGFTGFGRWY